MENANHLSENLRAYQRAQGKSLTGLSAELGIARSTVQSVLSDGNTTLDTLIRIAHATNSTLDELVFGDTPARRLDDIQSFLGQVGWFIRLPAEKQEKFLFYLQEMLKLLEHGP